MALFLFQERKWTGADITLTVFKMGNTPLDNTYAKPG